MHLSRLILILTLLSPVAAWTQAPVASPDGDTINIADSYTWTLVKDRAGIKVYMRSIEGTDSKEVKAVMEVAAPFEEVARLVNTSSRNHEWINVFRKSENITPESGDVYYEYTVLDLPFVATDRDLYLRIDFVQTSSGFLRGFTCVPDYKPAHPDLVRMDHFYGYWAGKMVDKNHTRITHILSTAPGAGTSEKFANNFVAGASYKTMANLRALAEAPSVVQTTSRRKRRFGS